MKLKIPSQNNILSTKLKSHLNIQRQTYWNQQENRRKTAY